MASRTRKGNAQAERDLRAKRDLRAERDLPTKRDLPTRIAATGAAIAAAVGFAVGGGLGAGSADAQELCRECEARFGALSLAPGFLPDPTERDVVAGGGFDARRLAPTCEGFIAGDKPDLELDYAGGPLTISTRSEALVSLVVNDASGAWRCASGDAPTLVWENAPSGAYDVWVGSIDLVVAPEAVVRFSERPPRATEAGGPLAAASAAVGGAAGETPEICIACPAGVDTLALSTGFQPDPIALRAQAGGLLDAAAVDESCAGLIDRTRPSLDFDFDGGPLAVSAQPLPEAADEAPLDLTLVVNDAQGRWVCSDDAVGDKPAVAWEDAPAGHYDVWIGVFVDDDAGFFGRLGALFGLGGDDPAGAREIDADTAQILSRAIAGAPAAVFLSASETPHFSGALCLTCAPVDGAVALAPGFTPDPWIRGVRAGGDVDAEAVEPAGEDAESCVGWVRGDGPTLRLEWGGGPLSIAAIGKADTTLIVNDAGGAWRCSDDADGANPGLGFADAPAGAYDIWVGLFDGPGETVDVDLLIRERAEPF